MSDYFPDAPELPSDVERQALVTLLVLDELVGAGKLPDNWRFPRETARPTIDRLRREGFRPAPSEVLGTLNAARKKWGGVGVDDVESLASDVLSRLASQDN